MRRLTMFTLALIAGLGWFFIISAGPAHADDCASRVKGITDLGKASNVQDCLRTGSNWGRVIGTVVGATGVVIAGVGLVPNRKPQQPPKRGRQPSSQDPCAQLAASGRRIHQLDVAKKQLEAHIVQEWQSHAQGAQALTSSFRQLKEIEWKIAQAVSFAQAFNFSALGALVLGIGGALEAAGPVLAAKWATWWTGAAVAPALPEVVQLGTAAKMGATAVAALSSQLFSDRLPPWLPGPKPTADFWAQEIQNKLVADVTPVVQQYRAAALAFNRAFGQWAVDRQQDLDRMNQEIDQEATRWMQLADKCPSADTPDLPAGGQTTPIEIQVIQVPTELGGMWFMGSTF